MDLQLKTNELTVCLKLNLISAVITLSKAHFLETNINLETKEYLDSMLSLWQPQLVLTNWGPLSLCLIL